MSYQLETTLTLKRFTIMATFKTSDYTAKFFSADPFMLAEKTNEIGQTFKLWSHPSGLGDSFIYVSFETESGIFLACTYFLETYDMLNIANYEPVMFDGEFYCMFEYWQTLPQHEYKLQYTHAGKVLYTGTFTSHLTDYDFTESLYSIGNGLHTSMLDANIPINEMNLGKVNIYKDNKHVNTYRYQTRQLEY